MPKKYRMKILVEELNDNNSRTGREMVIQMDHVPRERNRIGLMVSHWLQQANLYFEASNEERFPGEALNVQRIIGELKLLIKKIESGTYKVAELIGMSSVVQESSFGDACLVINIQRENPDAKSD